MVLPCSDTVPSARKIKEGDLVVVYESYTSIKAVYVKPGEVFQNRYGKFQHKDWLGVPFGSRVTARGGGSGWVFLLAPSAELWTQVLRHRTQILYVADISLVVAQLGLCPGKTVLESGTGSGSLTHALARAVAPSGAVHTFDFHGQRAAEAAAEFARHGLGAYVSVAQRNIEQDGFPAELAGRADALFLDLPGPWKVVPSAAACLKPGGSFCSFSPCIEQVQRTAEQLDRHGFVDIRTLEILLRTYDVSAETLHTSIARDSLPNKQSKKRSRTALAAAAAAAADEDAAAASAGGSGAATGGDNGCVRQVLAQPAMEARGHTGFLTFARRFVAAVPLAGYTASDEEDEEEEEEQEQGQEEEEQGAAAAAGSSAAAAAGGGGGGGDSVKPAAKAARAPRAQPPPRAAAAAAVAAVPAAAATPAVPAAADPAVDDELDALY